MESIERPLRLHRDREHPVVRFPHLDPQLPRTLPPKQPHLCPAGRALGKLADAWESRRHRSSLSADPGPFRACLESNGRGQHGEEPRARSVWMTPSWLGGSWPKSPPFPQDPDARQPLPHRQSVRKPVRLRRAMANRYGARPFSRPGVPGRHRMRGKSAVAHSARSASGSAFGSAAPPATERTRWRLPFASGSLRFRHGLFRLIVPVGG